MSVRRRQNWQGQQRVDVPHLKSVESAVSNDFDELISGLITGQDKSYVIRGFKINMPGSIGSSANGLQLLVEDSSFLHGSSNESGSFYTIPVGTPAEILSSTTNERVEGAFTPNTDNYVGIEFVRAVDDSTVDQVYFWNPTTNVEITKTVPLAIILDYKIVISTSSFASNVMPITVVQTDSSNNVISITDRRPLLTRLGTAGDAEPDPFYDYPWLEGRAENFYTSTSSTSDPFSGGDKQIKNLKEFFDALMTEFKVLKGTPFWYSASAGSISRVRQDIANTAFTGKGNISHAITMFNGQVAGMTTDVIITAQNANVTLLADSIDDIDTLISDWNADEDNADNQLTLASGDGSQIPTANISIVSTPGQMNWNSDIFLNFIGGRLRYQISENEYGSDVTLLDNQVAYLQLVRGEAITPNLVFTNGGTVVTSVGSVNWTSDLQSGDFIKNASEGDVKYYEIASVDSLAQVTLTTPFQELSSGPAGFDAQYAFGVYETNPSPSNERHVQIANREDVPFGEDYFWLFFRQDDTGSLPKVYVRVLGGQELEQGESQGISDNTSKDILTYIGSASETDNSPDYLNAFGPSEVEVTTFSFPPAASLTTGQRFTINSASDIEQFYVWANIDVGGGDPTPAGLTGVEVAILSTDTDVQVAGKFHAAIDVLSAFNSVDNGDGTITVTNADPGATTDAANVDMGGSFSLNVDTQGAGEKNYYLVDGYDLTKGLKTLDSNLGAVASSLTGVEKVVRQNKNTKLVGGGVWSWDLLTTTLTLSADAQVSIGGLPDARNNIIAQDIVIANDGEVAYVNINRTTGPAANLTVLVADVAALTLTDDLVILARRVDDVVLVGGNSFMLKDEEFLELDGALAEINRYHGQLSVRPNNPQDGRIRISGSDIAKLNGSTLSLEQKNLLLSMPPVEIDFSTGEVFEEDGLTPFLGGINDFTPFAIGANEYFFYSVSVLPNTANADNTISGQILVIPATGSDATFSAAPKAPFPGSGIKLANVWVQEDGSGDILAIDYANITQLGVGGSGSGTGDANSDLTRYQDRINLAPFYCADTNIAAVNESDKLDVSSTAVFDIPSGTFKFLDSTAQTLVSTQSLDDEFLEPVDEDGNPLPASDLDTVELYTIWELDNIDEAATYEVSRDGGNEYQEIAIKRIGKSDSYRGVHTFTEEAANAFNQEYAVGNADALKDFNDSSAFDISQKFTVAATTVYKDLFLYVNKATANAVGKFCVEIVKDDAGAPSSDPADSEWTSTFKNVADLAIGNDVAQFDSHFVLKPGDYHILVKPDQEYTDGYTNNNADKISLRINGTAGPVPNLRTYDGSVWSAEVANETVTYRLEGRVLDVRVRITSSATADDKLLRSYALFYDYESGVEYNNPVFLKPFRFDGTVDNDNEFIIDTFLPDSRLLMCFARGTGQVFRYGDFVLDGHKAIFPENTFNVTGTVYLEFFQVQGVGNQASTVADALVTANHLGSTDPLINKSLPGRGFILENANGDMIEVGLDGNNNWTFTIL